MKLDDMLINILNGDTSHIDMMKANTGICIESPKEDWKPIEKKLLQGQKLIKLIEEDISRLIESIKIFESYYEKKNKIDPILKQIKYLERFLEESKK